MSADRELLELAAKAAGMGGGWEWPRGAKKPSFYRDSNGRAWSPLDDDGDALRLAVKLRICVLWQHDWVMAYSGDSTAREHDLSDRGAALRRAIVRAAAELGKAMP